MRDCLPDENLAGTPQWVANAGGARTCAGTKTQSKWQTRVSEFRLQGSILLFWELCCAGDKLCDSIAGMVSDGVCKFSSVGMAHINEHSQMLARSHRKPLDASVIDASK